MITFKEVNEKDLSILANLFSAICLDTKLNEDWNYDSALSYMNYFYHYQPDLFICAYDENIPIGAVMSTLKPYYDGIHLTQTEVFVSEDYTEQNIEKKLLEMHFELANAKYDASYIDAITYASNSLNWYKDIGLEQNSNLVVLNGKLENCLKNLSKNF